MSKNLRRLALVLVLLGFGSLTLAAEPRPLDISITTHLGDQQSFVDGDSISFLLTLERDAWVYLFYRDASGSLLQLLPNERMPDHFFKAGLFMPIPNEAQRFQFEVSPPYGAETLYAIASDNGDLSFSGKPLPNGLILLQAGIEALTREIRQNSAEFYGQGQLSISTAPGQGE